MLLRPPLRPAVPRLCPGQGAEGGHAPRRRAPRGPPRPPAARGCGEREGALVDWGPEPVPRHEQRGHPGIRNPERSKGEGSAGGIFLCGAGSVSVFLLTAPGRGPSGSEAGLFPFRKEEPRLSPFRRNGMEAFSLQGPRTWAFSLQGEAFPLQGGAFSLQDRGFFPSGQGKPCPGGGTWEGETEVALTRHQTPKGSADDGKRLSKLTELTKLRWTLRSVFLGRTKPL